VFLVKIDINSFTLYTLGSSLLTYPSLSPHRQRCKLTTPKPTMTTERAYHTLGESWFLQNIAQCGMDPPLPPPRHMHSMLIYPALANEIRENPSRVRNSPDINRLLSVLAALSIGRSPSRYLSKGFGTGFTTPRHTSYMVMHFSQARPVPKKAM
jgi:hypothetical protein